MTLDLPLHLPPRDDAPRPAAPSAVPVALALGERHVGSVRRWLEGTLGWQAVDDDLDGPVPPTVRLVDLEGGMRLLDSGRTDRLPTLLLVEDDDVAALAADVARRLQPAGVCPWPDGRDALPDLVARTLGARRHGVEVVLVLPVIALLVLGLIQVAALGRDLLVRTRPRASVRASQRRPRGRARRSGPRALPLRSCAAWSSRSPRRCAATVTSSSSRSSPSTASGR